jgi:arsenical pump membrane protein
LFDFIITLLSCFFNVISITIIALILDQIGLFRWFILTLIYTAEGSSRRLFIHITILTAFTSFFLNNIAAVLVLTPIILNTLHKLKFNRIQMLPFLLACSIIPDIVSIIPVVSNPISLISASLINSSLKRYISIMFIVGFIALVTQTILILLYFKKSIKNSYSSSFILNPDDEVIDWNGFNFGILIVLFLFIGHIIALNTNTPISLVSLLGLIIFICYCTKKNISVEISDISQKTLKLLVFVFIICIITYYLFINKFNCILYPKLYNMSNAKIFVIPLLSGILTSISSSFLNNIPSILINTQMIKNISISVDAKELLSYSSIIGNVIGAKFIPIGSISTIIWFNILKLKGIKMTWKEYIIYSAILITPVFLLSLIILGIIM